MNALKGLVLLPDSEGSNLFGSGVGPENPWFLN